MRLASLDITGFRAFAGRQLLDLDADTVIIVGANGQGKTSIFDSVLWALTGTIPRLEGPEAVLSLFSDAGECRVALGLSGDAAGSFGVVRSLAGSDERISLTTDGETAHGPAATSGLLERLWPDALFAHEPFAAFVAAMETGVYLQQDLVRGFIDAASDEDRFNTIGELVGAGRVTELQAQLESSRHAWSRATNRRESEVAEIVARQEGLRGQLQRLQGSRSSEPFDNQAWDVWWARARAVGLPAGDIAPPNSAAAAAALDAAIKELQAIEQSVWRGRVVALSLQSALRELPPSPEEDAPALEEAAERARAALGAARVALEETERQAAELRRQQVQLAEARSELRALAELALRHLGDHCPVCNQEYDNEETQRRLEAAVAVDDTSSALAQPDVAKSATAVQDAEGVLAAATRAANAARQRRQEWDERAAQLAARAEQLGFGDMPRQQWKSELERQLPGYDARLAELGNLREGADRLAISLARIGEQARASEIERELSELDPSVVEATADLNGRRATGDMLSQIIEGLRAASSDVVEERLQRMEPLLQRIYATADPHPAFRAARLVSRMRRGRGRVVPEIKDPMNGPTSESPETVLSSSQMNVLAVSVFLALNLAMPALPLDTVILDDPLQSLDDMNLLGLVDLLRRTRERRQVLISTHDPRLAGLLERKLRPVRSDQRTIVIDIQGWSREGPVITQRDVEHDRTPLRIAAA